MTKFLVKLAAISVAWQVGAFAWFVVASFMNYLGTA